MDSAYLAFILLGVGVGCVVFSVAWCRQGLVLDHRLVWFVTSVALCALAGARLYSLVEQGWHADAVIVVDGGMRIPGAVLGGLFGITFWRRILVPSVPLGLIGDLGAVAAQFALVVVRLGCLSIGCCFGTRSSVPWAISFPVGTEAAKFHSAMGWVPLGAASQPVHPLPVYFMLWHLVVAAVLIILWHRKRYNGQILLLSLALGQGGKGILETFRQPLIGAGSEHLQLASFIIAGTALVLLVANSATRAGWIETEGRRRSEMGEF